MNDTIFDNEYLYRGIVENCWDKDNNRPSSAAFKDSKGISVNRDAGRSINDCVKQLMDMKNFRAICRLTAGEVRECEAVVKYLPVSNNIYHSEIHNSENQVEIKSKSKARRLNQKAKLIFEIKNYLTICYDVIK